MKTKLQQWGNSQGIRIPKKIAVCLGLDIGSEVLVQLNNERSAITVSPVLDARPVRGRHNLDNLIAESAVDAFVGTEEWDDAHGREVW